MILAAVERRDFRFIMIDRQGTVPGLERYPQLKAMHIAELPVIALRITRASDWGNLTPVAPAAEP